MRFNNTLKAVYEPSQQPYLSRPGCESRKLRLDSSIRIREAFSGEAIDYTQRIDSSACLDSRIFDKTESGLFFNVNDIEIQHASNAREDLLPFIHHAHKRLSYSHAKQFPLREPNNDIPVWYDGKEWLIPMYRDQRYRRGETEQCHWRQFKGALPNLWFNQDIDSILAEYQSDVALFSLLTGPFSCFMIGEKVRGGLGVCFSPALGVFVE